MAIRRRQSLPRARDKDLLVEELGQETIIYDLTSHKAHCLNQAANLVRRHCDGQTTVKVLAEIVQEELDTPRSQALEIVQAALVQLEKANLLADHLAPDLAGSKYSRRQLVQNLGVLLAPLVMTLAIPSPAAAASNTCTGTRGLCGSKRCPAGLTCQPIGNGNSCGCQN